MWQRDVIGWIESTNGKQKINKNSTAKKSDNSIWLPPKSSISLFFDLCLSLSRSMRDNVSSQEKVVLSLAIFGNFSGWIYFTCAFNWIDSTICIRSFSTNLSNGKSLMPGAATNLLVMRKQCNEKICAFTSKWKGHKQLFTHDKSHDTHSTWPMSMVLFKLKIGNGFEVLLYIMFASFQSPLPPVAWSLECTPFVACRRCDAQSKWSTIAVAYMCVEV